MGPTGGRSTTPRSSSPSDPFPRPADAYVYVAGTHAGILNHPDSLMSFGDRVRTLSSPSLRRSSVSGGPSLVDVEVNSWYNGVFSLVSISEDLYCSHFREILISCAVVLAS